MSRVDEEQQVSGEGSISETNEDLGEDMQRCLDEIVGVLRKYEIGVTLCLANDRESVLMYRIPDWCAVMLNDGEPEINHDKLWQTDDLEQLLSRTYRLANTLCQTNERLHTESARREEFVRDLGQHLLDPNRKSH